MDVLNLEPTLRAIEFELDDYKCVRFFDRSGILSVLGPNEYGKVCPAMFPSTHHYVRTIYLESSWLPSDPKHICMKNFTRSWT
jgi:hypothetical protein